MGWVSSENRSVIVISCGASCAPAAWSISATTRCPAGRRSLRFSTCSIATPRLLDAPGTAVANRLDNAMKFVEGLLATSPGYLRANPGFGQRFAKDMQKDRTYLAHEYLNRHWSPVHFLSLAESFAPAKLSFACSATYLDHFDALHLIDQQRAFLGRIGDPVIRQTVRDFMVNKDFRRDLWVKGPRRLTLPEQTEALRGERVVLIRDRADIELKVAGALGEVALSEAVYGPLLDALSDHRPRFCPLSSGPVGACRPRTAVMADGMRRVTAAHDEVICDRVQSQSIA